MPFATDGRWSAPAKTPGDSRAVGDNLGVMAVHAALCRTGELVLYSGRLEGSALRYESWLWNPDQPTATAIRNPFPPRNPANPPSWPNVDDLFCSHHVFLEDGRLLVVGGAGAVSEGDALGLRSVYIFDPDGETSPAIRQPRWQRQAVDLTEGRWYPTAVMLADGRVAVVSGRRTDGAIAQTVEVLGPPGYAPQTLAVLSGREPRLPIYPGLHLVPGGRVFHSGTNWRYEAPAVGTVALRVTGTTAAWEDIGLNPNVVDREEGMSVLLPPAQDGRVLLLGGARWFNFAGSQLSAMAPASEPRSAEILDTRAVPPRWTRIGTAAAPALNSPRINPNAVLLPDGKVLVLGGHDGFKFDGRTPSNRAEIYDPVGNAFTPVGTMNRERQYHSVALLLPDGRVFSAAGVAGVGGGVNQLDMEFYEPPYFFNPDDTLATRPSITNVFRDDGPDDRIAYGGEFFIETPNAVDIRKVALMRPGAPTHHTDSEQRYVALAFSPVPGTNRLRVVVPGDPSVAPPGYYMLWIVDRNDRPCQRARFIRVSPQQCFVITDRTTFSSDEVAPGPALTQFGDSLYVVMDGFTPEELGINAATPTTPPPDAVSPTVSFRRADNSVVAEMSATVQQLLFELPTVPAGVRQRFMFKMSVSIAGTAPFFQADGTTPIETQEVAVEAASAGYACRGSLRLTQQPNPYMLDGSPPWLSVDVRVFKLSQGDTRFGRTVGADAAGAIAFIQSVLADFNTPQGAGASSFNSLSTDPTVSQLDLLESRGGRRVFNFAIAQVRYRGRTLNAPDVRVFFRSFTTAATGLDYAVGTTYRRETNPQGEPVGVLGLQGGQIATIPYFAEARVNPTLQSMTEQRDTRNTRTINAAGGDTTAYFGCWLDFNQTALRYPLYPGGLGPYTSGLLSIQELIRGRHQCLVAEVFFGPDPIPDGATPDNNDNLSQRNLAILEAPNPGTPASRRVQHTFELKPSVDLLPPVGAGHDALPQGDVPVLAMLAPPLPVRAGPDELMIRWGNLPRATVATLFIPGVGSDSILELAARRIGPPTLERVDEDTIRFVIGDVTFVPLPAGRTAAIPALLTVELPPTIKRRQSYTVVVQQVAGASRAVIGSVELPIVVSTARELLREEARTLSVLRHIALAIPVADRWHPVFQRYVGQISDRVREFGGDPDRVTPSPDGTGADGDWHPKQPLCELPWGLVAILLAVLVFALGLAPGTASLVIAVAAALALVVVGYFWQARCHPTYWSWFGPVLLGLAAGGALVGLLLIAGTGGTAAPVVAALVPLLLVGLLLAAFARGDRLHLRP